MSLVRSTKDSGFVRGLQDEARAANLPINVGIHEPVEGGKKVKNTLIWIDGKGDIVQRYQKLHLFDVEIENGPVLRESKYAVFNSMIFVSCLPEKGRRKGYGDPPTLRYSCGPCWPYHML